MTTEPEGAAAAGDYAPVRAAVLRVVGEPMVVETIHLKTVGPDDVRVRIDQTGVCHSDLSSLARGVLQQPVPAVLGHEACGTIVELGESVVDLDVGQRVVLLWITPCFGTASIAHRESRTCAATDPGAQRYHAMTEQGEPVFPGLTVGAFAEQPLYLATRSSPCSTTSPRRTRRFWAVPSPPGSGRSSRPPGSPPARRCWSSASWWVGLSVLQGARLAGASTIIAVDRNSDKEPAARPQAPTTSSRPTRTRSPPSAT